MMKTNFLDTVGLKCPQPTLRLALTATQMNPGEILEVLGNCPTFEEDIRFWCERLGKLVLSVKDENENKKRIQIQF
jgi:tRNA 2-thiouridine synthesizing protein A